MGIQDIVARPADHDLDVHADAVPFSRGAIVRGEREDVGGLAGTQSAREGDVRGHCIPISHAGERRRRDSARGDRGDRQCLTEATGSARYRQHVTDRVTSAGTIHRERRHLRIRVRRDVHRR